MRQIGTAFLRLRRGARALAIGGVAAATALLVASCGDGRSVEPPLPESPVHEATFGDQGGEANREGPDSPAAEQVEDRAYPRTYVDDRLALQGKRSFKRLPGALPRSAFRSTASFKDGLAAAPRSWRVLGPVTPEVAPEASQFFDPSTGNGATTTQSGRVTAMAIDPNCGRPGRGCRLWVAAAGGGIWRTNDALSRQPRWIAPPGALPTNAFGSLIVDPNDPGGNTLYAGSGEPNGSGDSEAGLGLFRSTDGGRSWHLVRGSRKVAINRSIGSIAVEPGDPRTIYIGTDVARHGSSSVNGGRRTPPNAPGLGVYKSTDGGRHFALEKNLKGQTPPNPADPATGLDWFQGGVNKLQIDPGDPHTVYAAVFGYGLWRSKDGGHTWSQVFHTLYQNDFSDPVDTGDTVGDRTEFDLVEIRGHTRIYVGDSSDDLFVAEFWRVERAETKTASELIGKDDNAGWTKISDRHNGTNGFLSYNYCQNGQCGYDDFVVSPPGRPDTVWLGGSMAYDELPLYGGIPRSNGRAVIRSTNAGVKRAEVTFQDMTQDARPRATREGMHPDQHDIAFDPRNPDIAFVGSDGGVIRVHVTHPQDRSSACDSRTAVYDPDAGPEPLAPDDLADCRTLLRGIPSRLVSLNVGLNDIQFQSLSYNPKKPARDLLGGTQDNGTFSYSASPKWLETVGGDGGQSGFDPADPTTRYHNYYDATPEVNFHGNAAQHWLDIYDVLQLSGENQSFYAPFIADPQMGGRAFTGLQHVWRTDDNGGDQAYLEAHCNALYLDPNRQACGDWQALGQDLTGPEFGEDRQGEYVVATARAPSNTGTLWAATRIGRLFVTENADAAQPAQVDFTRIDTPSTPGRFVSGIAIDPQDPNHAWVSYSGYSRYTPGTPGHLFEVEYDPSSQTASFTDSTYDLGDQPVTGIAFDAATGDAYAATDFGVARLPQGATGWEDAAPGLPAVGVYGITLSPRRHLLFAATHGRGAYSLRLASP